MALSTPQPPSGANRKSVPHILFEKGKITREQGSDIMLRMKGAPGTSVEKILIEMGVSDVDITQAQAEIAGVPFVDLLRNKPSDDAKGLVPAELQSRLRATPLNVEGNTLVVAMEDPKNFHALDDLKMLTKMEIRAVMAAPSQVEAFKSGKAIGGMALNGSNGHANGEATKVVDLDAASPEAWDKYDETVADMLGGLAPIEQVENPNARKKKPATEISEEDAAKAGTDLSAESVSADGTLAEEAPIIRIVNTVLLYALKDGASDIHVEPQQKGVRIRYRIDGVLHEQMKIPQYVLNPLIRALKSCRK
jgi:type IV pilus assembly protein PilB